MGNRSVRWFKFLVPTPTSDSCLYWPTAQKPSEEWIWGRWSAKLDAWGAGIKYAAHLGWQGRYFLGPSAREAADKYAKRPWRRWKFR